MHLPIVARTLYAAISRHDLAWMLRLFDFPDPNITSGGRVETTVPLQQLFVLNSEFMVANARAVAARLQGTTPPALARATTTASAGLTCCSLAARRPSAKLDLGLAVSPSGRQRSVRRAAGLSRWERYAQALLAANEFLFVD